MKTGRKKSEGEGEWKREDERGDRVGAHNLMKGTGIKWGMGNSCKE